jgi:hypothetical protein
MNDVVEAFEQDAPQRRAADGPLCVERLSIAVRKIDREQALQAMIEKGRRRSAVRAFRIKPPVNRLLGLCCPSR